MSALFCAAKLVTGQKNVHDGTVDALVGGMVGVELAGKDAHDLFERTDLHKLVNGLDAGFVAVTGIEDNGF